MRQTVEMYYTRETTRCYIYEQREADKSPLVIQDKIYLAKEAFPEGSPTESITVTFTDE